MRKIFSIIIICAFILSPIAAYPIGEEGIITMTNAEFAGLLTKVIGLEAPDTSNEALSSEEIYKVLSSILAEKGINIFSNVNPDGPVTKGILADAIYGALYGASYLSVDEKILFLSDAGYLKSGSKDDVMDKTEILTTLRIPALYKKVVEPYTPSSEMEISAPERATPQDESPTSKT
ncbi:MAG: hypothetical protein PHW46_04860 [Candidatus Omnitrophica bacterium]|nr:hypothetical protein [Candidatus Omnitrophota bacterium]